MNNKELKNKITNDLTSLLPLVINTAKQYWMENIDHINTPSLFPDNDIPTGDTPKIQTDLTIKYKNQYSWAEFASKLGYLAAINNRQFTSNPKITSIYNSETKDRAIFLTITMKDDLGNIEQKSIVIDDGKTPGWADYIGYDWTPLSAIMLPNKN